MCGYYFAYSMDTRRLELGISKNLFEQHRKQFITVLVSETVRSNWMGLILTLRVKEPGTEIRKLFSNLLRNLLLPLKPREGANCR